MRFQRININLLNCQIYNQRRTLMQEIRHNFEGLWFEIYKKVLTLNKGLRARGLDKGQLREVATTIFIAQTNKGIVRPYNFSKFQMEMLKMTAPIKEKTVQKAIKESISMLTENGKQESVAQSKI